MQVKSKRPSSSAFHHGLADEPIEESRGPQQPPPSPSTPAPWGTDRYQYVWKTQQAWAGHCRTFRMTLVDGSVHEAEFRLR